jgi:ABC-type ATPase involved in cell division
MRIDRLNERRRVAYRRKNLGFIFQFYNLIPTLTVEENVRFPLELNGLPGLAEQALARLDTLGVADRAHAFPETLSGGEQQRVAIARALASEPLLLLADEPTGNLDERATRGIMDLFWEINALGMAVLMATHDLELMRRYPRARVLELDQGELVYDSENSEASGGGSEGRYGQGLSASATAGDGAGGRQELAPEDEN